MVDVLGTIAALTRHPVKSLVGERVDAVTVDRRGVVGDRQWAVRDPEGKLGSGKNSRRFRRMPGLLDLVARMDDGVPVIGFPDGRELRGDDPGVHGALSAHLDREVRLAPETDVPHLDEGPLHLLSTASLAWLADRLGGPVDPRRFRANLLLDCGDEPELPEQDWIGRSLAIGDEVVVQVRDAMVRCVMVDMEQRDVPSDGRVLTTLGDANDTCLGVVMDVVRGGVIRVGDRVSAA